MQIEKCFEILEVPIGTSYEEAKAAYRMMCQVWHPDKHCHNVQLHSKATKKMQEINSAWNHIQTYYQSGYEPKAETESNRTEQSARDDINSMIFDFIDNEFVHVICPKCKRDAKIKRSSVQKRDWGFSLGGTGSCSCGFVFENIKMSTVNKEATYGFAQAYREYLARPWWIAILPVLAAALLRSCKGD